MHRASRLICSREALRANWTWLSRKAGVACGAAIKADGYGLGAQEVATTLGELGCRDFFVSTWAEAATLRNLAEGASLVVLHGLQSDDVPEALASRARPTLNSAQQVQRWREIAPDRPCDVMVDTGMNRLGLRPDEIGVLEGLRIDTVHSHLACADQVHPLNAIQLDLFRDLTCVIPARRYALANSAGICLGRNFSFDLVRPGLALYGGIPRDEARGHIGAVAILEAQVVQRRVVMAGESCGYGATFVADSDTQVAILNIGYADGYWRSFSTGGQAIADGHSLAVLGRVSMDLIAVRCDAVPGLSEGDWVQVDFELERSAAVTGKTQYELLNGLGDRFERVWR